ncbi:capsular biosynthesis protein [Microbulbifer elongatus]|uniref:Capsular biosynthesis protein n=1 Tax=Microbulbifer elongatus TaxID=86173 RepID=A0ABT1NWP4_9GAMM|nr:capsular biosynthesis protein [Microbulbifer elongatus]MCQ3828312.1 capsular biosynthesis protein [Microbulbifer elongatus]
MTGVVFLQGPHGPFFARCARYFSACGIATHKINFNGGDRFFAWADHQVDYTGGRASWPEYLAGYLRQHDIHSVVVYGDCREYHREARAICDQLGVAFWVFEEGYLRPDFVTLEQGGVNGFSLTDWTPETVRRYQPHNRSTNVYIGRTFWQRAYFAVAYYISARIAQREFPHYRHHRPRNWLQEGICWLKSGYRKGVYKLTQRKYLRALTERHSGEFYLYALQTQDDFQIREHSSYSGIEDSIGEVVRSFAEGAAQNELLVIKHHPMDRGFCHYGCLIEGLARAHGVSGRIVYCHDLHLPTLLDHAKGLITINSTVGISALLHGVPTITLGRALYDQRGLTHQGKLDDFWQSAQPVDNGLFEAFRTYLYEQTQLDGSFFRNLDHAVALAWVRMSPSLVADIESDVPDVADEKEYAAA